MDRNRVNKVYINPNFKKNLEKPKSHTESLGSSKNYYLQQVQSSKQQMNVNISNPSRKIYFNPNFKQLAQPQYAPPTLSKTDNSTDAKVTPTYTCQSKYSLVYHSLPNNGPENTCINNISHYNTDNSMHKPDLYNDMKLNTRNILLDNNPKVVPIVKSRYSLIRNKVSCQNMTKTVSSVQGTSNYKSMNIFNNLSPAGSYFNEKNKPAEKVTKIKLSKYKTVPITYLKENHHTIKNKQYGLNKVSHIKIEKNSRYHIRNKNRYNLTRSQPKEISTPMKVNIQTIKRNTWQHLNRIKLKKTNLKLNNIPCQLFRKYGKCLRKDNGKCDYLHDKKHVSLCRMFLKGICHNSNCLLSHESTANKMPTCSFYLKGMCTKENCPYLHVKLSDKIKICPHFLKGYCEKGDKCPLRHTKTNLSKKEISSSLITTNKFSQKKNIKVTKTENSKAHIRQSLTLLKDKNIEKIQNENLHCRYYKDAGANEDVCENIKPTRCELGTLPSYIQL